MASATTAVFRDLNPQQTDGMSCVVCNAPFHVPPVIEHVPVGVAAKGGQVFACDTAECAMAIGYVAVSEQLPLADGYGTACVAPESGVHTSCPGPAAGTRVVATPAVGHSVEVHFGPGQGGWHAAVVRDIDVTDGRFVGAWVALKGGGSHWVSPDRIRPAGATVVAR